MTDLKPITALGLPLPQRESIGALKLSEVADLGFASLALRAGQAAPSPFGLVLPEVSRVANSDGVSAFWTGRGQWMIEGAHLGESDFAAAVRVEAPGCSVTEQTDGFVCFEIASGAGAAPIEALMAKLVNIDPATLPAGQATRTGLEHMTVFLVRRTDDRLAVIGMRTLAAALWHTLTTAAERLKEMSV